MKNAALYWKLVMDGVETFNRFCKKEQERNAQREVVKNLDPEMKDYFNEKNYQEHKVHEIEHDITFAAAELEATYRLAEVLFGVRYDDVAQEIRKQWEKKYNAPEPKAAEEVTLTDLNRDCSLSVRNDRLDLMMVGQGEYQMKESFYKTTKETILAGVVDRIYNDEIGERENHYYDTNEMLPITEEELIHMAVCKILRSRTTLWTERGYGIEPNHIRFMGKERVTEIVEHQIKYRHRKEGKWIFED